MKNILLFIYRNHVFFVFLLLEVASFSLIVRNNNFHRGSVLNSSNLMVGRLYEFNNGVSEYFKLKSINDELALENAALRAVLRESKFTVATGTTAVTDSVVQQQYTYLAAKVINSTTDRRNNYLTINRGMLQGVAPEMAVISSTGIVGIVKDVSRNYSSVISVLHKNSSISAKLIDSGYIGSLVWDGTDPQVAQLLDIPNHVEITKGMLVQTSGYSAIFPSGINIGTVRSSIVKDGDNFHTIEVELLTNMRSVSMVYVVNDLMRIEKIELEQQVTTNDL